MDIDNLSKEQKKLLLSALREQELRQKENKFSYMFPDYGDFARSKYLKHIDFIDATSKYNEVAFIAANQIGKTQTGAFIVTALATGEYPDWWTGKRFEGPVEIWCSGTTTETTRDVIQKALLGPSKLEMGTGMIPKSKIVDIRPRPGVPDAINKIFVQHVSGGVSKITLKSYDQKRRSFEGGTVHGVWLDEEPEDSGIYAECLTRTVSTSGILIATFTPLKGISEVVTKFLPGGMFPDKGKVDNYKFVVNASWEDVPHLSEFDKLRLKASYLPHELEARTKGYPAIGSGKIYPLPEADFVVEPFKIPSHWPIAFGMDVGWNKTAVIWGAIDPNTDILYLYDEYYRGQAEPAVHVAAVHSRGDWITGAIDYAGLNQSNGERLFHVYRQLDLNVIKTKKGVDAGIFQVYRRLTEGKLKVFSTCKNWIWENRLYRRDEKGEIVKENDHLMDATQYLVTTGVRVARTAPDFDDTGSSRNRDFRDPSSSDITGY